MRLGEVGGEVEGEGVELVLRLVLEMEGTSRRLEVDIWETKGYTRPFSLAIALLELITGLNWPVWCV